MCVILLVVWYLIWPTGKLRTSVGEKCNNNSEKRESWTDFKKGAFEMNALCCGFHFILLRVPCSFSFLFMVSLVLTPFHSFQQFSCTPVSSFVYTIFMRPTFVWMFYLYEKKVFGVIARWRFLAFNSVGGWLLAWFVCVRVCVWSVSLDAA